MAIAQSYVNVTFCEWFSTRLKTPGCCWLSVADNAPPTSFLNYILRTCTIINHAQECMT